MHNPKKNIIYLIKKVFKSMGFLGTFISFMRIAACLLRYRPKIDSIFLILLSMLCTSGILFEDIGRGESYSLFTIPKVLEGFWDFLKKLGYAKDIPYMINIIFAISIGILLFLKKYHFKDMPHNYVNQISLLFEDENRI